MRVVLFGRSLLVLVTALAVVSVEPVSGQEAASRPVAEDELAPVHAIQQRLRERLGQPVADLDLDLIMEGADFSGTAPAGVRWDAGSDRVWFQWKRWDEERTGTWEYDLTGAGLRRLDEDEADLVPAAFAVWDRDHAKAAWTRGDSVMLYDAGTVYPLVSGLDGARPVTFSGAGDQLVVRVGNNLLAVALGAQTGQPALRQLTDIRSGSAPEPERGSDSQQWLREQQLAMFDVLARRDDRREEQRERVDRLEADPLYLEGWQVTGMAPSHDLGWVAVLQSRDASGDRVASVPDYVTASGYTEEIRSRVKVGDDHDSERLGILHVATGAVAWVDAGLADRELSWAGVEWSEDSRRVLAQVRSQDNKDRWFAVVTPSLRAPTPEAEQQQPAGGAAEQPAGVAAEVSDPEVAESGAAAVPEPPVALATVLAFHDHDDAWINWSVAGGNGWLPGDDAFFLVSERDGFMHLYTVAAAGGEPRQLTRGSYEVFAPRLHPDRDSFVFEASIVDPFEVHAYRLPLRGGDPQQLSDGHGREDVVLSPDGATMAMVASSGNRPPELYLRGVGVGAERRITDSPSPAFQSFDWVDPEIVHFVARDGVRVPARIYEPAQPGPVRPAVVFVHGAGYLQNVHRWWSSYSREYSFHHLLTARGYTVLDIDYRGSAGYGRDWRTAIYRHMGGKDLDDQVDGVRFLAEQRGVDAERVGLYGGSYGGFITLMALFTAGEHFAAGAALRPVTDWAHYNHPYTSNILDNPQDDSESYWKSSPIYFAEGLEDPLLICHGVVDTNVHFQGVVRLAQRLIELRKRDWEVALYPVESHGFVESASWADEYSRILELFERHLE